MSMMTQTITAGTQIQHRKVGRALLVAPTYSASTCALREDGAGWWNVQFTTGKYKGGAPRALWITPEMIIK